MAARFLDEFDLRPGAVDGSDWTVRDTFRFEYNGQIFECPAGFTTDLASVPRIPLFYLLTGGTATKPAVAHDRLYNTQEVDREIADTIFLELCVAVEVPAWRRNLMYAAVRAFGWRYWNKRKKEGKASEPEAKDDIYFG